MSELLAESESSISPLKHSHNMLGAAWSTLARHSSALHSCTNSRRSLLMEVRAFQAMGVIVEEKLQMTEQYPQLLVSSLPLGSTNKYFTPNSNRAKQDTNTELLLVVKLVNIDFIKTYCTSKKRFHCFNNSTTPFPDQGCTLSHLTAFPLVSGHCPACFVHE